jgi:hypothetical protein
MMKKNNLKTLVLLIICLVFATQLNNRLQSQAWDAKHIIAISIASVFVLLSSANSIITGLVFNKILAHNKLLEKSIKPIENMGDAKKKDHHHIITI